MTPVQLGTMVKRRLPEDCYYVQIEEPVQAGVMSARVYWLDGSIGEGETSPTKFK